MESIQEMERIIQEAVSKAIASQMVIHSEKVEKNIANHLSVFSSRLELIEKKIDKFQTSQGGVHNKLDTIDLFIKKHTSLLFAWNRGNGCFCFMLYGSG